MRDNKPIELEAENYVCTRLAKMNLKYAKPNFDLDGGDLIVINHISKDIYKSINIQVKGRDITNNNSNVKIHKDYLSVNFVFFLYLKTNQDFSDYLYCFFDNDISNWKLMDDNYYLNIPQKSIEDDVFKPYLFSQDKALKLSNILNTQKQKYYNDNTEWNLTLLENNLRLWETTKCLPDYNLTNWFLENINPLYSLISHNIFLTCLAIMHSDKLETVSAVDYMFIHFKNCEIDTDATISDINVESTFTSEWLVTYSKSKVDLLSLNYNGITHTALRLKFGDNEEQINAILIANGDLILTYN